MAISKKALATRVLRKMAVVAADESPASTDSTYVMSIYDDKLEEWRDRKLIYWPNTGEDVAEIPSVVVPALVNLIINEVATTFGKAPIGDEELLLKPLRRHVARAPTGLPLRVDYF